MPKILVCGMAVADFLFKVDELPSDARKYVAGDASLVLGGGAANAALAIARLGGQPSLVARLGNDWTGELIQKKITDEQIDTRFVLKSEQATTSYSAVMVDLKGERQIINYRGQGLGDEAPDFSQLEVDGECISAALTDTRWENGGNAVLLKAAAEGRPGVVDAEAPLCHSILHNASHIAFSLQGLQSYRTQMKSDDLTQVAAALEQARDEFKAWVCVTDGDNGVYSLPVPGVENLQHHPAYKITAVDTLAAGDVWHGAFTWQLGEGKDESTAIAFANACAALKCMHAGGGASAPNLKEVESFIANTA